MRHIVYRQGFNTEMKMKNVQYHCQKLPKTTYITSPGNVCKITVQQIFNSGIQFEISLNFRIKCSQNHQCSTQKYTERTLFILYSKCSCSTFVHGLSTCGFYKPYIYLLYDPCPLDFVRHTDTAQYPLQTNDKGGGLVDGAGGGLEHDANIHHCPGKYVNKLQSRTRCT